MHGQLLNIFEIIVIGIIVSNWKTCLIMSSSPLLQWPERRRWTHRVISTRINVFILPVWSETRSLGRRRSKLVIESRKLFSRGILMQAIWLLHPALIKKHVIWSVMLQKKLDGSLLQNPFTAKFWRRKLITSFSASAFQTNKTTRWMIVILPTKCASNIK